MGDGNSGSFEEITTYPFEDKKNKAYKIQLPESSTANEIAIDSCLLNKGKKALIKKWGEDEGNLIVSKSNSFDRSHEL